LLCGDQSLCLSTLTLDTVVLTTRHALRLQRRMKRKATRTAWLFVFEAPLPGLISNQVHEGFAQLYELRAFMEYDGNNGINAQC
jgi:hypothetical protein